MIELLRRLSEVVAPPSHEEAAAAVIREELAGKVDELQTDALGNLIAFRRGEGSRGRCRVMLAAHLDEVGLVITHVDEQGFVRFAPVGSLSPQVLLGQRVAFPGGITGVVGAERLEEGKELNFRRMYVDVGAADQKEAQSLVRVGEMAALSQRVEVAGGRLVGKALDDRAGCAVLVRVLQELRRCPHDLYCVFTVQEEVGRRGAWTAAYQVEPDLAVVVDVTPAGDTPEPEQKGVALGKGPAVKVMDRSVISHPQVRRLLAETAERHGLPYQWEVLERGGTDAGSIHVSRSGVPTGALSLPARYLHTPNEMVDLEDLRYAALLLLRFLEEPLEECFPR